MRRVFCDLGELYILLCVGFGAFGPFCVVDGGFLGVFYGGFLGCCFRFLGVVG